MLGANHDLTGNMANVSETGGFKNRAGRKLGVSMLKIKALEKPVEGRARRANVQVSDKIIRAGQEELQKQGRRGSLRNSGYGSSGAHISLYPFGSSKRISQTM